ncbi:PFL_4703 family integrating conjugative element protein [Xenorhabdus griffiniae]|uniref:PFL_4703 family integrating conjugative element protein n=1 Tax=Xenorhabdus griffiniae TaxID=351672 RepID=UPI002358C87A|nr:TIGR03746 family integrating conjugative element protein [Xenorhabdus griffiniae]MDC9604384.1 TIGR03746 family integrating conjugative element protein [Xenorhabdus griffiniae]
MSRFRHALLNRDQHILTLRVICCVLVLLLFVAFGGWFSAPRNLTIHNPPDLRAGSTRAWWEIPDSTVYAFTFYIFQQINAWAKDGETDFPKKIEMLSPYLTPSCKAFFQKEAQYRTDIGELRDRVRVIYEIPGRGYSENKVSIVNRDNWIVQLDVVVDEYYHAEPVKRAVVRYPIKVTRWEGDQESNPFGLALDCYDGIPQRLAAISEAQDAKRNK